MRRRAYVPGDEQPRLQARGNRSSRANNTTCHKQAQDARAEVRVSVGQGPLWTRCEIFFRELIRISFMPVRLLNHQ